MPSVSLLVLSVVEAPRGGWKIPVSDVSDVLSKVVATGGTDCREGGGLFSMLLSDIARGAQALSSQENRCLKSVLHPRRVVDLFLRSPHLHTRAYLQARARCKSAGDNHRRKPRELP